MGVAAAPASRRLNVLPAFGMESGCELRRFVMHSSISASRFFAVLPKLSAGVSWNVAERIVSVFSADAVDVVDAAVDAASSWNMLWR